MLSRASFPMAVLTATAALLCMALAIPAVGRELLVNGGFEEADLSPWQVLGGSLSRVASPDPGSGEGAYAAQYMSEGSGFGQVRQEIPVGPGGTYLFSGSALLQGGSGARSVTLRVSWKDAARDEIKRQDLSPALATQGPPFRPLLLGTLRAPPGTVWAHATVLIESEGEGATVYLDDMRFEEVSPPPPPTATSIAAPSQTPKGTALASATVVPSVTPAPTGIPTPSHGLLVNGGFEAAADGVPVGWQKYGGIIQQVSSPVRSGSAAGAFGSQTESTKWVYQTVPVEGGAWYSLEGHVCANDPGVAAAYLRVSWYASADGSGTALSGDDSLGRLEGAAEGFRYLTTGSVPAPPQAHSAKARIMLAPVSAARATIFLDDMTFAPAGAATPTPAPSAAMTAARGSPSTPASGHEAGRSPARREVRGTAQAPGSGGETSPFSVKINEVLYDPEAEDGDAAHEWVELYNAGSEPVELRGWSVTDNTSTDPLPDLHLGAGDFAVVAGSELFRNDWPEYDGPLAALDDGRVGNGLSNLGDRLILRDSEGRIVDTLSYGEDSSILEPPVPAVAADHSLERRPPGRDTDTAADFEDNPDPSPGFGLAGPGATPTATLISEVSSIAWEPVRGSGGIGWWPWALVGGLVAGGVGAGTALVARRRHRARGGGAA